MYNQSSYNPENFENIDWDKYSAIASTAPEKPERPDRPKGYDSTNSEVPSGVYRLEITNVDKWTSHDGRESSYKYFVRIKDEESIWKGRNFVIFFTFDNPIESRKVEGIANFMKLCKAVGLSRVKNPTELVGKEFIGTTVMKHHKTKVNNNGQPFANYFINEYESVPEFKDTHKQSVPDATPKGTKYVEDVVDEDIPF